MSKLNISNIDLKYLNFNIKEFKSQGYTYYHIQKQLDNIKLTDLRKEHLQKYFNNLIKSNLKLSTIKTFKVFINTVLNYAVDEDYI